MDHTNILLYSKFSPASRKFIETIETSDILEKQFTLLCIDNKKIRQRIQKSSKLNIKEVPCILRIYQDTGYAESFEGEKAFQLLNRYVKEIKKEIVTTTPQYIQPVQLLQKNMNPTIVPTNTPIQKPLQPPSQLLPQMPQMPQLQELENVNISQLVPESQPKHDSIQKQQKLINATSIDELGSDINRGQTMNTYMHVPKSVEFDIDIENRQRTVKTDRSVKSSDSGNIVTRAMQMQKEREQESSMPPGPRSMPMS
jgi:hypothetical protein